jgi:hypothetical protein
LLAEQQRGEASVILSANRRRATVVGGLLDGELCDETIAIRLAARCASSSLRSDRSLVSAINGTIIVVAIPALSMIGSACSIVPSQGPGNSSAFMNALVALADG